MSHWFDWFELNSQFLIWSGWWRLLTQLLSKIKFNHFKCELWLLLLRSKVNYFSSLLHPFLKLHPDSIYITGKAPVILKVCFLQVHLTRWRLLKNQWEHQIFFIDEFVWYVCQFIILLDGRNYECFVSCLLLIGTFVVKLSNVFYG